MGLIEFLMVLFTFLNGCLEFIASQNSFYSYLSTILNLPQGFSVGRLSMPIINHRHVNCQIFARFHFVFEVNLVLRVISKYCINFYQHRNDLNQTYIYSFSVSINFHQLEIMLTPLKSVWQFLNYWYFRYLMVTELYMVEKWERAVASILLIQLQTLCIFNNHAQGKLTV